MKKNPLAIARPDLAKQFHPSKNPGISPDEISYLHKEEVWWLCEKGHEWSEKVSSRSRQKKEGCKICGSLAITHPELARELHPTLNGTLRAEDITSGCHLKVWWICPKEHEYDATVKNRAVNESGCPYCSGKKITKDRSIAVTHPQVAKRLHPTKNGDLSPNKITANYLEQVWWLCEQGHEWQETIQNCCRQSQVICKVCRSIGYLKPELLEEWHPDNELCPFKTPANYNEHVRWKCKTCRHEWPSSVANRFRGSGCPGCSGAEPTPQTSIATLCPDIAKEWDYHSNAKTPDDYTKGSTEKVYWICSNNHSYKESIYNRTTRGRGCPTCKTVAFLCPHLLEEWAPTNSLSPHEEFAGSGKEVDWICKDCRHPWKAKIVARFHGQGCPNCNSGWTIDNIRRFVASLLPYLEILSPAGLYVLFQQKGLLSIAKDAKGRSFVEALKTGRFPKEDLEKFIQGQPSLVDDFISNPQIVLNAPENTLNKSEYRLLEGESSDLNVDLPTVETKDVLAALSSKLFSSLDREAMEFFIKEAVARIWQHAFAEESKAFQQLEEYKEEGLYAQEVRNLFLADYSETKALIIPDGYSFPHQPNLMQKYTAYLVKSRKRLGNWSGTGAGKTLSAILASRVIEAKLTVICCPNNVIDNWERNIQGIYPGRGVNKSFRPLFQTLG